MIQMHIYLKRICLVYVSYFITIQTIMFKISKHFLRFLFTVVKMSHCEFRQLQASVWLKNIYLYYYYTLCTRGLKINEKWTFYTWIWKKNGIKGKFTNVQIDIYHFKFSISWLKLFLLKHFRFFPEDSSCILNSCCLKSYLYSACLSKMLILSCVFDLKTSDLDI